MGEEDLQVFDRNVLDGIDFSSYPGMDFSGQFWGEGDAAPSTARDYVFVQENPFRADERALQHGIQLFRDGKLGEAILAFEAVVQREPMSSDAWRWLGTAHAENDEDKVYVVQRVLLERPRN